MNDAFFQHYRTLDLKPGCPWSQVKTSYRRLVRIWHPDRYQQEHPERLQAEERIKEINHAFRALENYYKEHGELPMPVTQVMAHQPAPAGAETASSAREDTGTDVTTSTHTGYGPDPTLHARESPGNGGHPRSVRLAAALIIAWACYELWYWQPEPFAQPAREAQIEGRAGSAGHAGDPGDDVRPGAKQEFFALGSTLGDVHAAQGIPTATTEGIWYYGKSKVYFEHGRVSRWENDPSSPLRVGPDTTINSSKYSGIGIGRTKAEVRSIQGNPLLEGENEWDYGASKVYFQRGRVTGWHSSEFSPLKIEK